MDTNLQISFLGMSPSDAIAAEIRERALALERHGAQIVACHASVDAKHGRQRHGGCVAVRLVITLPQHELIISHCEHEDAYVAVREAFEDMTRQIHDVAGRERARRHDAAAPAP